MSTQTADAAGSTFAEIARSTRDNRAEITRRLRPEIGAAVTPLRQRHID